MAIATFPQNHIQGLKNEEEFYTYSNKVREDSRSKQRLLFKKNDDKIYSLIASVGDLKAYIEQLL